MSKTQGKDKKKILFKKNIKSFISNKDDKLIKFIFFY